MRMKLLRTFVVILIVSLLLPAVPMAATTSIQHVTFEGQTLRELDMAYGRPVRVSSGGSAANATNAQANAVNHAPTLRWDASTGTTPWLIVDLGELPAGEVHQFNAVYVRTRGAHNVIDYQIQVTDFTGPLASAPTADADWITVASNSPDGLHGELLEFDLVSTPRYVRIIQNRSSGAGGLTLFQVYNITHPSIRDMILHPPFSYMSPYPHLIYQPERVDAQIVVPGIDGSLYRAEFHILDIMGGFQLGNRMPDFSVTGFQSSNVEIPFVDIYTLRLEPDPLGGDDTARINAAIRTIGERTETDENGFRGVVHLAPGTFRVSGASSNAIQLHSSGVVLRGSGQGPDGTVILHTNRAGSFGMNNAITIQMGRTAGDAVRLHGAVDVLPGFYPIGSNTVRVTDVSGFNVGEQIMIRRGVTPGWTAFINQAIAGPNLAGRGGEWGTGDGNISMERTIAAIDPATNTITFYGTLVHALNVPFEADATVSRIDESLRTMNVGIENMRLISNFDPADGRLSEFHPATAIRVQGTRNGFVRDVTTLHYSYATVNVSSRASDITVLNSTSLDPVVNDGSGRRYAFVVDDGKSTLMDGNYSQYARFCFVTNSNIAGPVVFLDSLSENNTVGPETHHR